MKKLLLVLAIAFGGLLFSPQPAYAVDVFNPVCQQAEKNGADKPSVCKEADLDRPLLGPNGLIDGIVTVLSFIVGIVAIFVLVIFGGLKFITSGGEPNAIAGARRAIIFSAAGIAIAVLSRVIVEMVINKVAV